MTILEAATKFRVCTGDCGLGPKNHWRGVIDPWGGVHYAARRFTRRAFRNMLLLVAKRDRESNNMLNEEYFLNAPHLAWYHLYWDNVTASRLALELGTRLPARLSRRDRLRCLQLARKHGVRLSKRSAVYAWATDV